MPSPNAVEEPARSVPVVHDCDVCVVGGSCTGVFAAVRAAQAGCRVALIEGNGFFGGVATAGLVNVWHSRYDTEHREPIFAGLTTEVLERLHRRGAAEYVGPNADVWGLFNSAELVLELDALVGEHDAIRPFLHCHFAAPLTDGDGRVTHAVVEDKSGRRAVAARVFIDATGDGDLAARAGCAFTLPEVLQPPTVCAVFAGLGDVLAEHPEINLGAFVSDPALPGAIRKGFLWHMQVPGLSGARMVAGTRVHGADASDADQLTAAEREGRRQAAAIRRLIREHMPDGERVGLAAIASSIGIRETRHIHCRHRLTEEEVLEGVRFPDAVAQGSYRVDVHHADREGLTFRYLDGREVYRDMDGAREGRWRDPRETDPTFYQIPYRSLVPEGMENLLVAGRCLDADRGAFGGVRVMVTCNQTGEAAGTAAALACDAGAPVGDVDPQLLRDRLRERGAILA